MDVCAVCEFFALPWVVHCCALLCIGPDCSYIFIGCTRACVCGFDGNVIFVDHDLNRCTGWWPV